MRRFVLLLLFVSLSSMAMASKPELVWTGGSFTLSSEDSPGYSLDSFVSLGSYNSMYLFSEPILNLKHSELGISIGAGVRLPVLSGQAIMGYNAFYDYTDDHHHKRIGTGAEIYLKNFSAHMNIYLPLSSREGREEALAGMDFCVGIPIPLKDMGYISLWPGFYYFRGEDEDDMQGLSFEVHYQPMKIVTFSVGARNDALSAGKDDSEVFARVEVKIPMKRLGKDLFRFTKGMYPQDIRSYMDHSVVRQHWITYEKKTKPWDMY